MNPRAFAIVFLLLFNLGVHAQKIPVRRLAEKLAPCRVPDVEEEVLCGRHEVYENRAAGTGRKIALNVVVLPAKTPEVELDPLVFLAGGGVAPATRYASFLNGAFADLRLHRDILLIDQRGSGASNPLDCDLSTDPANPEYRNEARFKSAVRRCRKELELKADLRFYTTPFAMDDLDDVRGWLGYPRLNLYGASYGTQAAMVYVRQHPERVRTVALQGVVPLDLPMWLEVPRSAQTALDLAFAACAGQAGCHGAFPNLAEEFTSLLKRLAEKPVKVKVSLPEGGKPVEIPIDAEILRVYVMKVLYSAERIHDLPLLIHLAQAGDYRPLARNLVPQGESGIPKGVYLSIVCNEELHFDPAALPKATAGTFMGAFRLGREILACKEWPHAQVAKDYWMPAPSNVPALILTGALDHATPPRYGEWAAKSFPHSRSIVLPNRGHNDVDPCVSGIVQAFVTAGGVKNLDTSCLATTEDLSFALRVEEMRN
ncbi:MAG TPA: alpha/beta hydrolase [Thermoanaerobaculia bacterium]|nr:alpha/beta hydrolase [Thermoanaerobaculia bacterium]